MYGPAREHRDSELMGSISSVTLGDPVSVGVKVTVVHGERAGLMTVLPSHSGFNFYGHTRG